MVQSGNCIHQRSKSNDKADHDREHLIEVLKAEFIPLHN